jgi:hypothetical protein
MKKMTLALITSMILLPVLSFAQTTPQAPASWIAFQKQENAKRQAFYQQLKSDRDTFLNANPDVKTYLEQMRANAKTRMAAWRAAHPPKNPINPALTPAQ